VTVERPNSALVSDVCAAALRAFYQRATTRTLGITHG
jgi:hypothetical protein